MLGFSGWTTFCVSVHIKGWQKKSCRRKCRDNSHIQSVALVGIRLIKYEGCFKCSLKKKKKLVQLNTVCLSSYLPFCFVEIKI